MRQRKPKEIRIDNDLFNVKYGTYDEGSNVVFIECNSWIESKDIEYQNAISELKKRLKSNAKRIFNNNHIITIDTKEGRLSNNKKIPIYIDIMMKNNTDKKYTQLIPWISVSINDLLHNSICNIPINFYKNKK